MCVNNILALPSCPYTKSDFVRPLIFGGKQGVICNLGLTIKAHKPAGAVKARPLMCSKRAYSFMALARRLKSVLEVKLVQPFLYTSAEHILRDIKKLSVPIEVSDSLTFYIVIWKAFTSKARMASYPGLCPTPLRNP